MAPLPSEVTESAWTTEQVLISFLNAMPGHAFVKDFNDNLIYSNLRQKSDGYPTTMEYQAMKEKGTLNASADECNTPTIDDSTITFPLLNNQGEAFANGYLTLDKSAFKIDEPLMKKHKEIHSIQERDKKDTKHSSKQSPQNYQSLFRNMPMGAAVNEIITNEENQPIDWIFREVNPGFEALTGLKADDIIGKRVSECIPGIENDPCDWIKQFGQVAITGEIYTFNQKYDKFLKKWYGGIAYRPGGEGVFATVFSDDTDRIKREEALQESEERHRNLFESMMQGVVYQDAEGGIVSVNPSAERILGMTKDQMMGRTSVDPRWKSIREDGSDFPGNEHPSMTALKTGKPVTGVMMGVYHPASDSQHWIVIDAIPRFHPDEDKPFQVYSTFTDMTQMKEFERRILREKNRAEMADRLKSAFLANMSHEIRTPLNGIIGHIDLALSNQLSSECCAENLDGLNVARQSGELLITIIQDILDLSKIEAAQLDIDHDGHFVVHEVIDQVRSIGNTIISQRSKSITLEIDKPQNVHPFLCGDVFRLQQVLNNLVSNAIKFTDNGTVKLEIEISGDMLEFSVCDTGKGIPGEHQESIFEPFRQVEFGDTRKHGGTGLGLTISRKLVEMMGGTIWVKSSIEKPMNGSRFTFTYPYRKYTPTNEQLIDASSTMSDEKRYEQESRMIANGKILVAEDETVSRRMVKRMLEISGYEVLLAENGLQAVEIFKSRVDIALILMDVQMPILDGLSATKQIRELEYTSGKTNVVPIIALSAGAMKGDNERGLEVGMTDYLTKPVNFKVLKATLLKHLGAPSNPLV